MPTSSILGSLANSTFSGRTSGISDGGGGIQRFAKQSAPGQQGFESHPIVKGTMQSCGRATLTKAEIKSIKNINLYYSN